MAEVSLLTLIDTHLQIDAVANDIDFRRLQVIEEVAVVPIVVANGILVLRQAFVELFLIVDVALLHA